MNIQGRKNLFFDLGEAMNAQFISCSIHPPTLKDSFVEDEVEIYLKTFAYGSFLIKIFP